MRIDQFLNPYFIYRNRRRIIPYLEKRRDYRKLSKFKDRHRGEGCFIIGNGPSLTLEDLEKLKGETTFAANKIWLIFDKTDWRPQYYVLEDDHIINQHQEEIRRLKGLPKFVNRQWKHLFRDDPEAIWYPWHRLDDDEFPKFSDNALEIVYCGYQVTYISLQLAYFMGFSRVYLIGVDFNYSLAHQGQDTVEHSALVQDHFVPDYYKPGEMRYIPKLDLTERALRCGKEFYEAHGRKVYNATRGGKLEVFDRVCLEEALRS